VTTYYVKTGGDDSETGVSGDSAWETVSKVNGETFAAGDSILFNRGDEWSERLVPPSSGNTTSQITFGAFGAGERPIITCRAVFTGSGTEENWVAGVTDVWYLTINSGNPLRVWLDSTEYTEADDEDSVDSDDRWFYGSSGTRLYVYGVSNPFNDQVVEGSIAVQFRNYGVLMDDVGYLTFQELDVRAGINSIALAANVGSVDGLIIEDCDVGMDGSVGVYINGFVAASTCNDGVIRRCTIDSGLALQEPEHGDRTTMNGVMIVANGSNWEAYGNTVKDFYHSGMQIEGITTRESRYNKFHDNTISGASITYMRGVACSGADGTCQFNEFYNNLIQDTTARNQIAGDFNSFYYNIVDTVTNSPMTGNNGTAQGFSLEPLTPDNCHDNKLYNNVIYNTEEEGIRLHTYTTETVYNNDVANNVMMNCGNNTEVDPNGMTDIALVVTNDNDISNNLIRNNLMFSDGVADLVRYRGTDMTVAEFNAAAAQGDTVSGNIGGDPLFTDAGNADFTTASTSPTIDAGVVVGLTTDIIGSPVPQGASPDIGAYENVSSLSRSVEAMSRMVPHLEAYRWGLHPPSD